MYSVTVPLGKKGWALPLTQLPRKTHGVPNKITWSRRLRKKTESKASLLLALNDSNDKSYFKNGKISFTSLCLPDNGLGNPLAKHFIKCQSILYINIFQ